MVVSFLVVFALGSGADAGGTCSPGAALSGDLGALRTVRATLRQRGIQGDPAPGCAGMRVVITHRNGGLRVERLAPDGRLIARVVATPEVAALLIESWLRPDIAAPLLLGPRDPSGGAASGRPPLFPEDSPEIGLTEETLKTAPVAVAAVDAGLGGAVALVGEAGLDRKGSRAYGLGVASCVNLGPVCAGVAGRLARVSVAGANDAARESSGAYAADALLAADMPWHLGRATLRPGAAVGAGWVGARGPMLDRRDGALDVLGLRAEARLAMDWRLGRGFAIEVSAAGGAAGSSGVHDVARDAAGTPAGRERVTLDRKLVPAVRAGVGVRFGGSP